ncbi:hypothetical protein [Demequina muriae]|uniref:Tsi6 domain-containing protein n=1 Tax=Demequina muriae TaxID=3051664 RepID=A0ABT8GE46_9MICO|nr:hypothetical protein [Demequina sp. EGI L300058]MDN4479695.1 hypothetical protein [Demequina sp. EGI L300058]
MSIQNDLRTVERLMLSEHSIPIRLRMREGLDEDAYSDLTAALERLIDHYANHSDVPKRLALAFVDVGAAFDYPEGAYPDSELERIEDVGQELSQMGQMLFGDAD